MEKGSSKRKRNRVLPPRGKKGNNETPQPPTQLQPATQSQNETPQKEQTPPQPQSGKSSSPLQVHQKTRSPSTRKRKAKATVSVVKEKLSDNAIPAIPLEEAGASILKEEHKDIYSS